MNAVGVGGDFAIRKVPGTRPLNRSHTLYTKIENNFFYITSLCQRIDKRHVLVKFTQ